MQKRALFITFLIILTIRLLPAAPIHGMWVVRYALNDRQQTQHIVQMADQLQITDLYVQVWAKGRFLMRYNDVTSPIADSDQVNQNLIELIRKAHQKGIRVHAWLNVLNIWSGSKMPLQQKHLFYAAQKAVLRSANNDTLPNYKKLHEKGVDGYFIEPLNTQNLRLLKTLIKRLLVNYGVDGIHLDYFRLPGEQLLFSPEGRSAYILNHYFDPVQFFQAQSSKIFSSSQRPFARRQYLRYQQANMQQFLSILQQQVRKTNPAAFFSIAVKANIYQARSFYIQDWSAWLKKKLCDYVVLMNYVPDINQFLNNLYTAQKESIAKKIVVGVSTYNQTLPQVVAKLNYVKRLPFRGYTLFSFNDLDKKNDTSILALINRQ